LIKLSDYIVRLLEQQGVSTVFLVTGGGAMHLNDSFGQSTKIRKIFNHHEQGSAMAAEGYARTKGELAVVNVTTGPGGLNTLNGVLGQWTDSVPVLYISGQVRYDTTLESVRGRLNLRQLGDQEWDIISVVKPLTKFAAMIKDPKDVKWLMQKAIHLATSGRPGPVWLDVPLNVQSAMIDEERLLGYDGADLEYHRPDTLEHEVQLVVDLLEKAKRPVIVAGNGVRISGTVAELQALIRQLKIPVVTTINGFDTMPDDFPYYAGRIGTIGQRAGNFVLQNADLVLFLGTRNNIRQISYSWKFFARAAKKIAVDIDYEELRKPTIEYDMSVHADLRDLLPLLSRLSKGRGMPDWKWWQDWCQERRRRYPVVSQSQLDSPMINPYHFTHELTIQLPQDAVVVVGNGTASITLFQSAVVKEGQRMFLNSGCASMGYDVPAALGAACAVNRDVICLAGDGSFQMNIQEMATIVHNKLPVKIFYFDNGGYASIRQTQDNFFGRRYGIDSSSGISFPDTTKLAVAYGIQSYAIREKSTMVKDIKKVLSMSGSVLCHVYLDPAHVFEPKTSSERKPDGRMVSKPLEDLYPFLPRDEFRDNMIIEPAKED